MQDSCDGPVGGAAAERVDRSAGGSDDARVVIPLVSALDGLVLVVLLRSLLPPLVIALAVDGPVVILSFPSSSPWASMPRRLRSWSVIVLGGPAVAATPVEGRRRALHGSACTQTAAHLR